MGRASVDTTRATVAGATMAGVVMITSVAPREERGADESSGNSVDVWAGCRSSSNRWQAVRGLARFPARSRFDWEVPSAGPAAMRGFAAALHQSRPVAEQIASGRTYSAPPGPLFATLYGKRLTLLHEMGRVKHSFALGADLYVRSWRLAAHLSCARAGSRARSAALARRREPDVLRRRDGGASTFTEAERLTIRLLLQRPPGNQYPDNDCEDGGAGQSTSVAALVQ